MRSYPLALVADDEPINLLFLERVLGAAGWRVLTATDGSQAVRAAAADPPHLVVLDINMPGLDGWGAAAAIRASDGPAAGAPILAFTTLDTDATELRARGFDGRIAKPCTPDALVAAAASWRPDGEMAGLDRLSRAFDPDALRALTGRLRDQLAEALMSGLDDLGAAHRIAGAAGTLGFGRVSESWLALSQGDDSARDRAREDARRAIAAIDRAAAGAPERGSD